MADLKALPGNTAIAEASDLEVFDINGNKVKFGSIFEKQKTIVVFISMQLSLSMMLFNDSCTGHFFCGVRYQALS
jgi:hypothetical protein